MPEATTITNAASSKKRSLAESSDKSSRKKNKALLKRRREIEREAAARTLNANGRCPDLPPLPVSKSSSSSDQDASLGTLFGHPYGALPHGNSMAHSDPTTSPDHVRSTGLGILRCLNDEQILMLLSFLTGDDLGRWVQASRFAYVAGHHDELWRDLTLRSADAEKRSINFHKKWRDTYVLHECRAIKEAGHSNDSTDAEEKSNKEDAEKVETVESPSDLPAHFCPHKAIKISGIYSDTFYRSWLCRSFELNPSWLSTETIDRVDASNMTSERFLNDYEIANKPVIIYNATNNWPAIQKWNRQYLIDQTQHVTFRATSGAAPLPSSFTMSSYAKYCDGAAEEAPLYLFDRTFTQTVPHLLDDFVPSLKQTLPYLSPDAPHGHDLFSLLGEGRRPDYRWIIVGPKRSGSSFHIDPNCTHAWNIPVTGRKRWIFYPPGVNPPGVYPSKNGDDVTMPISIGEWFLTYWDEHCRRRDSPPTPPDERPLECTVSPGEILFVPHGWWHSVLNLDDGLSVALTQNYVSSSNLGDVLRFLDSRVGQISGCRDRNEAIKPEELGAEFNKVLGEKRPELLQSGEKAKAKGWSCKAWTDDFDDDEDACGGTAKKQKKERSSILDKAKSAGGEIGGDFGGNAFGGGGGGFSFGFM